MWSFYRVHLFQSVTTDSDDQRSRVHSSDDVSSVVSSSSSRCCCHGNHLLSSAAIGPCDSGLSSALSDAAAASRIAEMEAELAQLRQQLALVVMAQERAANSGHSWLPRHLLTMTSGAYLLQFVLFSRIN